MSALLDAALAYAAAGLRVLPCNPDKSPMIAGGFKNATTDPDVIRGWWTEEPTAWIAIATGDGSGVSVLDLDKKDGKDGFLAFPDWEGLTPAIALTANGGAHLYFLSADAPPSSVGKIAKGVDTRCGGAYAIAPPSPGYGWKNGSLLDVTLPSWPAHIKLPERREKPEAAPDDQQSGSVDPAEIQAALAVIPSDDEIVWFEIGCALRNALGEDGKPLFEAWSKKSVKYKERQCDKKWETCVGYNKLRVGTIFHYADEADPNWRARGMILDPNDPMPTARVLVEARHIAGQGRTIRHRGSFWIYDGACYRLADDEAVNSGIWTFLEHAKRKTEKGLAAFKPNTGRVSNVRNALAAICKIDDNLAPPAWLTDEARAPAAEFMACANGLLHLPTGVLHPPTADYFGLSASEVSFDPNAPEAALWQGFLREVLVDDDAIATLQDWMGYTLSPDTSQQKILMCVGPRRSGKGTVERLQHHLLGQNSVAGPTMSSLSMNFGLESLITKPLAIVSDARIGARTDKAAIVERLLSISGEDVLTVDRKHKDAWIGQLPTRFQILTNELPALNENSGALAGRFVVLSFPNSFYGREDPALTAKIAKEMPGILNWALAGYRRLKANGYFTQPERGKAMVEQIEMIGAPVKAFLRDCCNVGPAHTVEVDKLFKAWRDWNEANGGGQKGAGSKEWFGRNLRTALPGMDVVRKGEDRKATYVGVDIVPTQAKAGATQAEGKEERPPTEADPADQYL